MRTYVTGEDILAYKRRKDAVAAAPAAPAGPGAPGARRGRPRKVEAVPAEAVPVEAVPVEAVRAACPVEIRLTIWAFNEEEFRAGLDAVTQMLCEGYFSAARSRGQGPALVFAVVGADGEPMPLTA